MPRWTCLTLTCAPVGGDQVRVRVRVRVISHRLAQHVGYHLARALGEAEVHHRVRRAACEEHRHRAVGGVHAAGEIFPVGDLVRVRARVRLGVRVRVRVRVTVRA